MSFFGPYEPYSLQPTERRREKKILYPICWFLFGGNIAVVLLALFF